MHRPASSRSNKPSLLSFKLSQSAMLVICERPLVKCSHPTPSSPRCCWYSQQPPVPTDPSTAINLQRGRFCYIFSLLSFPLLPPPLGAAGRVISSGPARLTHHSLRSPHHLASSPAVKVPRNPRQLPRVSSPSLCQVSWCNYGLSVSCIRCVLGPVSSCLSVPRV